MTLRHARPRWVSGLTGISPTLSRLGAILAFLVCIAWQTQVQYHGGRLTLPWSVVVTAALTALLVICFLAARHPGAEGEADVSPRQGGMIGAYAGGALFLGGGAILLAVLLRDVCRIYWRAPITPYRADMLPLILSALRDFWRDGLYPYHFYQTGNWQTPLTYPPGLWLAFSPAYLLKVDIRYASAFCMGAVSMIGMFAAWAGRGRGRFAPLALLPAAAVIFWFYVMPPFDSLHAGLHVAPYWLAVVLWAWTTRRGHWVLSAVFFGWAFVARPPFVLVFPFWLLFLWRNRRQLPLIPMVLAFGFTGFVTSFFFFLRDPDAFCYGVNVWYKIGSDYFISSDPSRVHGIGWTGLLWHAGLYAWKMPAAGILVAAMLVWSGFRLRTANDLFCHAGVAMTLFLMFSIVPWFYVYFAPLHLLFFAAWPDRKPPDAPATKRASLAPLLIALAVPLALTATFCLRDARGIRKHSTDGELAGGESKRTNGLWCGGWGAAEGKGTKGRRLFAMDEAEAAVPVGSLKWREMEIRLEAADPARPPEPFLLAVYLNGELLGCQRAGPGDFSKPIVFQVPRGSLFRGLNAVHFSLRKDLNATGYAWRAASPRGDIALRSVRLSNPVPADFSKPVGW